MFVKDFSNIDKRKIEKDNHICRFTKVCKVADTINYLVND